jgi:hypothetical protein
MSELTQWNPNKRLMILANALRSTTDFLNKPGKIAGIGLGDLITGQAGSWVEDRAYGTPMTQGTGFARQLTNKEGLLDTAFLPGVGTAAAILRKGVPKVIPTRIDLDKRATMGNLGKGAAVAGMTTVAPGLIVDALRAGSKEVPSVAAKFPAKLLKARAELATDIRQMLDEFGIDYHMVDELKLSPDEAEKFVAIKAKQDAAKAIGEYSDEADADLFDLRNAIIDKYKWGDPQ